MPATYTVDKQRALVLSSASGVLTYADLAGHFERLKSDPDFSPGFREFFDFTGGTRVELSSTDVKAIANGAVFAPSARRAFLVADKLGFALGRMAESYHELRGEENVRVFRDKDLALRWLETGEVAGQ